MKPAAPVPLERAASLVLLAAAAGTRCVSLPARLPAGGHPRGRSGRERIGNRHPQSIRLLADSLQPRATRFRECSFQGEYPFGVARLADPDLPLDVTLTGFNPFIPLDDVWEENLRRMGEEIFAGRIGIDPFRKGQEIACASCQYAGICRIDPWTHQFRVLKVQKEETE